MSQRHISRLSDNPFIDRVWKTENLTDGVYLATPDASWDLILGIHEDGSRSMMVAGQATKSSHVPYKAGTSSVVISFTAGAYFPHLPGDKLLDAVEFLPNTDENHFDLAGYSFEFPTYETAETLVERMVELGLLRNDRVIEDVLQGKHKAYSKRVVQRHFAQTSGISQKKIQQIQRAQQAVRLLKQGAKPIEAAIEAGYTDQPHLAKSIKKIMGAKPSDIEDIHKL